MRPSPASPSLHGGVPRRAVLLAAAAGLIACPAFSATRKASAADRLAAIEHRFGGRLGVSALDTGSGRRLGYRDGERFAMCSTFKAMAAAAVLARVDQGRERLDRVVRYGGADLLEYAPVARARLAQGGMTVEALCAAAVELSDNTAANLLLSSLGGPAAVTAYARSIGDTAFRLDHNEPALNVVARGEVHDTTTPAAAVGSLDRLLLGAALSPASRARLLGWMKACQTGDARLRAGVPAGWVVADKTGTWSGGGRGSSNDIGLIMPPSAAPIVIAVFLAESPASGADRDQAIAAAARLVVATFSSRGTAHG